MPDPSQEREWTGICVLRVSLLPLSKIFYWILELFRQCDIFCFPFYFSNFSAILWLLDLFGEESIESYNELTDEAHSHGCVSSLNTWDGYQGQESVSETPQTNVDPTILKKNNNFCSIWICFNSFQDSIYFIFYSAAKYWEARPREWCYVYIYWSSSSSLSAAVGWNVMVCQW